MDATNALAVTTALMTLEKKLNTTEHLTIATNAMYAAAARAFNFETDAMAEINEEEFQHVYEWDEVGKPMSRLFYPTISGRGGTRSVSWQWLASKTFVPIVPEDYPSDFDTDKLNDTHIFIWKAPVMEYGTTVHVHRKTSSVLVIPFPESYSGLGAGKIHSDGNRDVLVTPHPYSFSPGKKAGVVGNFTSWFQQWWATRAEIVIDSEISRRRDQKFREAFAQATHGLGTTKAANKVSTFNVSAEGAMLGTEIAERVTKSLEAEYLRAARSKGEWMSE